MQKLVALTSRPSSGVTANQSRDIMLALETPQVMVARTEEVLNFLGLASLSLQIVSSPGLPTNLPHAYFPEPRALFAALNKKLSPREFSALCLKLLERYGDTVGNWLQGRLCNGLVKPDPANLKGWSSCVTGQPEGSINVYERAISPITRFHTGDAVYNLPARATRKPLLAAGMTPGSLLEWGMAFAFFPSLKTEIIRIDPWIIHPGTRVRRVVCDWSYVSLCSRWHGHAYCSDRWDDFVCPCDALFALL